MLFLRQMFAFGSFSPSGVFTVKSFFRELEDALVASSSLVWVGLAPSRVKAFCWLAISGKVSTTDNLRRRGILSDAISDICIFCGKEAESVNHLFLHCEFASSVWARLLCRSGMFLLSLARGQFCAGLLPLLSFGPFGTRKMAEFSRFFLVC